MNTENLERRWRWRRINVCLTMGTLSDNILPVHFLRKTFDCAGKPETASVFLCGLGRHELYVNVQKANDRVLASAVSQFENHVNFIEYGAAYLLKQGKNAAAVLPDRVIRDAEGCGEAVLAQSAEKKFLS